MPVIIHKRCLGTTILVVFALSGCQLTSEKWPMGLTGRANSKSKSGRTELQSALPKDSAKGNAGSSAQIDDLMREGDSLRRNRQYEDARLVYNRALLLSPDNPRIHHRLAIVADKQRMFSMADEHYRASLKALPNDVNILSDFGYSYSMRGDLPKAEEFLKRALTIDPTHQGAMANLGAVYARQDRYQEAQAMFRRGASEFQAQQYLDELFPDHSRPGTDALAGGAPLGNARLIPSRSDGDTSDLSQISLAELQAEMQRRKQKRVATTSDNPSFDADNGDADHSAAGSAVQTASREPSRSAANISWDTDTESEGTDDPTRLNNTATSIGAATRRKRDTEVQPARAVSGLSQLDLIPATEEPSVHERALEFGMNAGPGTPFSVIPGLDLLADESDNAAPAELSHQIHENDSAPDATLQQVPVVDSRESKRARPDSDKPTISATASSGAASTNSWNEPVETQPFDGRWPNTNRLPAQRTEPSGLKGRRTDRAQTTEMAPRQAAAKHAANHWSDSDTDAAGNTDEDGTDPSADEPASVEFDESWP